MSSDDLKQFIKDAGSGSHLRVEDDLGDGFVRLLSAEAERRQAKHDIRGTEDIVIEMLRNARDAGARNIFVATARDGDTRKLVMLDDGDGIPEHLCDLIFEARVTSKLDTMHFDTWGIHGRGMALYAIKANSSKAYVAATKQGGGSSFVIETNTKELPEKTDQSSQPTFTVSDAGTIVVRGTRNINRTIAEFSYIDRDNCSVYYGSFVDLAATLWEFGRLGVSGSTRAFCRDVNDLPVCKRLAIAQDSEEFAQIASGLGLDISSRSARRIMDGEITPLGCVADSIDPYRSLKGTNPSSMHDTQAPGQQKENRMFADRRGLKVEAGDIAELQSRISEAFKPLARDYYLNESVEPQIKVRRDSIRITIPVQKQL